MKRAMQLQKEQQQNSEQGPSRNASFSTALQRRRNVATLPHLAMPVVEPDDFMEKFRALLLSNQVRWYGHNCVGYR